MRRSSRGCRRGSRPSSGPGAFGLSFGLEYVPGIYTALPELAALGRVVARHDGVAMSHMRSENDDAVEASIDELIASVPHGRPHISHLKVVFGHGEARARALLAFLAAKRRQGVRLTADEYPYNAGYTTIALLFPEWALPPSDYAAVVRDRRQALADHLQARMTRRGGPEALLFGTPPYAGKTLAEVAREAGRPYVEILIALGPEGASGAHFTMDQALQDRLLVDPHVAFSTDGGPGMRHPRATGTYAKLVQDYVVRDHKLTPAGNGPQGDRLPRPDPPPARPRPHPPGREGRPPAVRPRQGQGALDLCRSARDGGGVRSGDGERAGGVCGGAEGRCGGGVVAGAWRGGMRELVHCYRNLPQPNVSPSEWVTELMLHHCSLRLDHISSDNCGQRLRAPTKSLSIASLSIIRSLSRPR